MTDYVTLSGGANGHSVTVTVTGSHALALAHEYSSIVTGGLATGEFTTSTGVSLTGSTGSETISTLIDQGAAFAEDPVSGTFVAIGIGTSTIFGGADAIFDLSGTSTVVGLSDTITATANVTVLGASGLVDTGSVSMRFVGSVDPTAPSIPAAGLGNDSLHGAAVSANAMSLSKILPAADSVAAGYSSGSITISDFGSAAGSLVALYGHSAETAATTLSTSIAGGSHTITLPDKSTITFSDLSHLKSTH